MVITWLMWRKMWEIYSKDSLAELLAFTLIHNTLWLGMTALNNVWWFRLRRRQQTIWPAKTKTSFGRTSLLYRMALYLRFHIGKNEISSASFVNYGFCHRKNKTIKAIQLFIGLYLSVIRNILFISPAIKSLIVPFIDFQ